MLESDAYDLSSDPRLHIIDRVKNITELYIDGRSVWIEQSKLEVR